MRTLISFSLGLIAAFFVDGFAQMVTLETPTQWISLRSDSVLVKMQVDTTQISKKNINIKLVSIVGKKTKTIATKAIPAKNNFIETVFKLGKTNFIGGRDFLRLEWSVSGKSDKGSVEPFGLSKVSAVDTQKCIKIKRVAANSDVQSVLGSLNAEQYLVIKNGGCALAWSEKGLFIAFKKSIQPNSITLAIDGKNGKNAFTAYADRYVDFNSIGDSVSTYYFTRTFSTDSISYTKMDWLTELNKTSNAEHVVALIPWYDLGVIPSIGRMVGLALFESDGTGKLVGALPQNAVQLIPGTWADAILE